ncbi:diguanylate cyclase domain-containing protein [Nucisporomicrobium flavum]|uniref:diguanylate cyclase domain-containing protein n=1 Tax=Nucisporomicrobium flavum TaxID=2785915 RepID=UPI0027DC701F|nr:diguanylate cyclase [Nucisporomicrobium flavum]
MRIPRGVVLVLSCVLALALIALVGGYLIATDRATGDRLRGEFANRAAVAAQLTSDAFTASAEQNRSTAQQTFSGDPGSVQKALDKDVSLAFSAVTTADGTVLGARPPSLRSAAGRKLLAPVRTRAQQRATMVFGDLVQDGEAQRLIFGVPFTAAGRPRVWLAAVPLDTLDVFAKGYLQSSLGTPGGRAFIVDAKGLVIARSAEGELGGPIPDQGVVAALRTAPTGVTGGDYYSSAPIPGTGWRVVFVAPQKVLLEPIQATRRLAWEIFGGFALAVLCMVALGATALTRSARLAHERLHDALTGLPNRTLFLEHVGRALAEQRRRGGRLAVLFIDLDGFKPINDVHGHAAGDALLRAVAQRLREDARRGDVLCRFGGDEFLVLCPGLAAGHEAVGVARRLVERIREPYEIQGRTVRVGSSVGVAVTGGGTTDATALIHDADQAMYEAKHRGRNRIEVFRRPVTAGTLT